MKTFSEYNFSIRISLNTCILFCCLAMLSINHAQANQLPEYTAFGLEPAQSLPDPESRQYITKTVKHNPPIDFNAEKNKTTQSVVISGHVLVFEPEHENGLWDSYHSDESQNHKTLKELELHADTIIIRGTLRLPQTDVTIYARELRFEDGVDTASINTTPYSATTVAEPQQSGIAGNPGGNMTLHVSSVSMTDSSVNRFILNGGEGQEGGAGKHGKNASHTKIWTGTVKRISGFVSKSYDFTSKERAMYVFWAKEGLANFYDIKEGDAKERPRNGGNASPSGTSGHGGKGGNLTAPLSIIEFNITSKPGGAGGLAAASVRGGSAGSPSTAYHWNCTWDGGCKRTKTYTARAGISYSRSPGNTGEEGQYIELNTQFSWLSAPLFSQSLRYAKDLYLTGYYENVGIYLSSIIGLVEAYQASSEWDQLDDLSVAELNQLLDEAQGLQQRLHAGLDYFSKPLGWVPGLSFEVNQTVYNNEIDNAMDVLWLTHSMQQNINNKQARKASAQSMVTTLNGEIGGLKDQYVQANDTITNLEPRIDQLSTTTENLKLKLDQRAEALRSKAEEAAVLNGIRDSLLKVTEYIPLANVATRVVFELPNIDPDKPVLEELFDITKDAAWDTANQTAENKQELSNCVANSGDVKKCAIAKGVREAQEGSDLAKIQGQLALDLISGHSANNSAVEAELQRILAEDPRWLALTEEITDLHTKKAALVADLIVAIDTLNQSSAAINKNLLAIDVFQQDVDNVNDILDPRVIAYTRDMAQRARHRLELYQYFMVKSYEYRMVRAYPFALDMNSLFDDFCKLEASKDKDKLEDVIEEGCEAEGVDLDREDFEKLGVLYKEQLSSIAEEIISEYNNGGGVSQDTAVEFDLPAQYLATINQNHEGVKLNLVNDFNLFSGAEEDLRIRSIEVIELGFNSPDAINYVDISFVHSGVSQIRKAGETYLFQHYLNSDTRPIQWVTRYNGDSSLQGLQTNSESSKSLIAAVIGNNAENLKIFASPAVWADIIVKRSASPDFSTDNVQMTNMRFRVNYEYTPSLASIKTLRVAAESNSKAPPIEVQTPDLQKRTDGQGSFIRSYATQEVVTLKAPLQYQQLKFQGWLENGALVSTDTTIDVLMDRDKTILPRYIAEGFESLAQLTELSVITLNGEASSTLIYAAALDTSGISAQQFGMNESFDIIAELHVSAEHQGSVRDIYIVVLYEGNWYMKDSNNNWQVWDVNIGSLVANTTRELSAINPITIVKDLSGLSGNFSVFVGHNANGGNIHYNSTPLNIIVN